MESDENAGFHYSSTENHGSYTVRGAFRRAICYTFHAATCSYGETMENIPADNKRLGEKEAAEFLGLSTHTLRRNRSIKIGPPYIRLGTRVVYDQADLRKWLNEHRVTANG